MALIHADVHLHTCLSPCAEVTQSPKRIVDRAYEIGLNMIFITDHNSIANVKSAMKAAEKYGGLIVYPGMEITTREEAHILSLFEKTEDAEILQEKINLHLPDAFYEKEKNEQIIANENDEVEGYYGKSLFSAVDLSINEIIRMIHENNGIAVAAHIDRPSFSVLSQLGFIPEDCSFDALEISPNMTIEEAVNIYGEYLSRYKFIKGSDSHSLELIGTAYTEFTGDNSFEGFQKYLRTDAEA